jgi:hypothetical protein
VLVFKRNLNLKKNKKGFLEGRESVDVPFLLGEESGFCERGTRQHLLLVSNEDIENEREKNPEEFKPIQQNPTEKQTKEKTFHV